MTIAMTMAMAYCGSMLLAKVVNTYQYNEKTGQQIEETFQNLMFDNSNNGTHTRIGTN